MTAAAPTRRRPHIVPSELNLALIDVLLATPERTIVSRQRVITDAKVDHPRAALARLADMQTVGFIAPVGADITVTRHGREWLAHVRDKGREHVDRPTNESGDA